MMDDLLAAAITMTTPVLLAALGGLVNRVAGLVNIGLESMMLVGALVALLVSATTGSWGLALGAAALAGATVGLALSLVVTRLDANEIVVGLGFNVAMAGLVRFMLKAAYGTSGTLNLSGTVMLPPIRVPGLDGVPVVGPLVSGHDPLTWAAWLLVPLTSYGVRRTRLGLRLRASGTAPTAVRALGLSPLGLRDLSSTVAGGLAGLAGADLSIGIVGLFSEGITGGRGFIALAAFYFGRNRPGLTALGALIFGLFDALQIRLQGHGIPAELVQTIPYLTVIAVLAGMAVARRSRAGRDVP